MKEIIQIVLNNLANYIRVIRTNQAPVFRRTANTYRLGLKHSCHISHQQGTLAVIEFTALALQ